MTRPYPPQQQPSGDAVDTPQTKAQRSRPPLVPHQHMPYQHMPYQHVPPQAPVPTGLLGQPRRRMPAAIRWGVPGLLVLVVGILVGVTLQPTQGVTSTSPTQSVASQVEPAVALTPGQRFVREFLSYPGLTTDMSEAEMIRLAASACDAIGTPGVTRDNMVAAVSTTKLGPQVAAVLIDIAKRTYCPEKEWSSAPGIEYTPGGSASSPQSGPLTTVSSGTYEVGTGDGQVPPGKYKSSGPTGSAPCYFARLKNNDGAMGDIIDNDLSQGPTVMTVKASDGYVEVNRCTFTKTG
jgi:hypothetical protein